MLPIERKLSGDRGEAAWIERRVHTTNNNNIPHSKLEEFEYLIFHLSFSTLVFEVTNHFKDCLHTKLHGVDTVSRGEHSVTTGHTCKADLVLYADIPLGDME